MQTTIFGPGGLMQSSFIQITSKVASNGNRVKA
jgi:hypothetical protein